MLKYTLRISKFGWGIPLRNQYSELFNISQSVGTPGFGNGLRERGCALVPDLLAGGGRSISRILRINAKEGFFQRVETLGKPRPTGRFGNAR